MPPAPQRSTSEGEVFGFGRAAWKRATREGSNVLLGQLGLALAGFAGLRLITQLAERSVFGEATLVLGAVTLGRNIFVAPFTNAQLRFHSEYAGLSQLNAFTRMTSRYAWQAAGAFAAVVTLAYAGWRIHLAADARGLLLLALLLCVFADTVKSVRLNWLGAERLQGRVAVWQVTDQVLQMGAAAAGILVARAAELRVTEFYLIGQCLGSLTAAALFGYLLFPVSRSSQDLPLEDAARPLLGRVARYGLPFIPLAVVSWAMNLGDRFALGYLMDADQVGGYVAAYAIASRAVMMPQGVLTGFARSVLFEAEGRGQVERGRKVFVLWLADTAACGILISAALWFAGPWVVGLVLDKRYREGAISILLLVGVGHVLNGVTQVVENRLMSLAVPHSMVLPAMAGALANVVACFVLIPRWGAVGAATAKILSFGTNAVLVSAALLRVHGRAVTDDLT